MIIALGAAAAIFFLAWHERGGWLLFCLIPLLLVFFPKTMIFAGSSGYVGIAGVNPTVSTYTVATVAGLLFLLLHRPAEVLRGLALWAPFVAAACYLAVTAWPHDGITAAGLLHVLTGIGIFVLARAFARTSQVTAWRLCCLVALMSALEALYAISDFTPWPLHQPSGGLAQSLVGRAIGSTAHPDQLAKVAVYLLVLVLAVDQADLRGRRLQTATSIVLLGVVAATQGRAGFIGAVVLVVLYSLLQPDVEQFRRRAAVLIGVGAVSVVAFASLAQRFQVDPNGGARGYLSIITENVISQDPLHGVGINHFVNVVGIGDALVGSGVPVHNAFLLTAAEMGIPAAALFWLPLVHLVVVSVTRLRREGTTGSAARIVVAATPAVVLLAVTGWGVLQSPTYELLMFVSGAVAGLQGRPLVVPEVMPTPRARVGAGIHATA